MSIKTKLEFDVDITCESCVKSINQELSKLDPEKVSNVEINVKNKSLFLETNLPHSVIQEAIEKSGRKAILKGFGSVGSPALEAAVVELTRPPVLGVVRLVQATLETCIIDGTIDGLTPGQHGMHVCQFGDLSRGCLGLGSHFNPTNQLHGGPSDVERHSGDLGNITADESGRAQFRIQDKMLKVWDVIGRSLAVSSNPDDLGCTSHPESKINGNCGEKVACGIIARSANLFENPKRICQCSGATVWEERDSHSKQK